MKKAVCFLLVLCFCLSGCGLSAHRVNSPFLTTEQREKLEGSLIDSLRILYDPNYPTSGVLYLQNDSDYHLVDVLIIDQNESMQVLYTAEIPPHSEIRMNVYASDGWEKAADDPLSLEYTIGEYSYYTEKLKATISPEENPDISPLRVTIHTIDGDMELVMNEAVNFTVGNEINGLSSGRIYSITPEASFSTSDGVYNILTLAVEGREPSGYTDLIAKLIDENGVVRDTTSVYFSDGSATIYFFCDMEPNLSYTVEFLELD